MTADATHSSVLNIPSLRTKEAPLKMKYEKEKQSNKDECPYATLQEVKLHCDRNREAVAAATKLAGGLKEVEGEERNGGAFWELPKSPHTPGGRTRRVEKTRGWGGSSVSMATVIAKVVVFPWTHLPSSSSFLQSAPLTPSLLHC